MYQSMKINRNDISALRFALWLNFDGIWIFNTLRPRQNGRRFADDTLKRIFLNENVRISIKISLKFLPKGPNNNNPALVQITAWRRSGDKPLSEPMMVSLLTHICVTRPQWVKVHDKCVDVRSTNWPPILNLNNYATMPSTTLCSIYNTRSDHQKEKLP